MNSSTALGYAIVAAVGSVLIGRWLGFDNNTSPVWYVVLVVPVAIAAALMSAVHDALVYRRRAESRENAQRTRDEKAAQDATWDDDLGAGTASGYTKGEGE